jgi:two-component system chemotaxis sensor kinase CheA
MQPVRNLFSRFPRLVRDVARQLGKQIELTISGGEVELDKAILDTISDPLTHLVRNACDHGLESADVRRSQGKPEVGRIALTARHEGDQISIVVGDDGRGIDRETVRQAALRRGLRLPRELAQMDDRDLLSLILLPGFTTAAQVTDLSGRGVGMDVVQTNLAQLGGSVQVESEVGRGTTVTLRLPLTLAIIPSILVSAAGQSFAIPQKDVEELIDCDRQRTRARVESSPNQEFVRLRGRLLPLLHLPQLLDGTSPWTVNRPVRSDDHADPVLMVILKAGVRRFALAIDGILSTEEIVIKPMHSRLRALKLYSGATILGDGTVALILNAEGMAEMGKLRFGSDADVQPTREQQAEVSGQQLLMLKQLNGESVAVPVSAVLRIVMVHRERLDLIGGDPYLSVEGTPTSLRALGSRWSAPWFTDRAFAVLPRVCDKPVGCVVSEVLGIESVRENDIRPLPDVPLAIGAAVLRGRLTPILDLRQACHDSSSADIERLPTGSSTAARILLVDDTPFFRDLVSGHLRESGFEVLTAVHGDEAVKMLEESSFDLVVSDLEMPVLDGFGLADAVRSVDAWRHLPLLALTTMTGSDVRERALKHGFDALEVKLDEETFLTTVRRLLKERRDG